MDSFVIKRIAHFILVMLAFIDVNGLLWNLNRPSTLSITLSITLWITL